VSWRDRGRHDLRRAVALSALVALVALLGACSASTPATTASEPARMTDSGDGGDSGDAGDAGDAASATEPVAAEAEAVDLSGEVVELHGEGRHVVVVLESGGFEVVTIHGGAVARVGIGDDEPAVMTIGGGTTYRVQSGAVVAAPLSELEAAGYPRAAGGAEYVTPVDWTTVRSWSGIDPFHYPARVAAQADGALAIAVDVYDDDGLIGHELDVRVDGGEWRTIALDAAPVDMAWDGRGHLWVVTATTDPVTRHARAFDGASARLVMSEVALIGNELAGLATGADRVWYVLDGTVSPLPEPGRGGVAGMIDQALPPIGDGRDPVAVAVDADSGQAYALSSDGTIREVGAEAVVGEVTAGADRLHVHAGIAVATCVGCTTAEIVELARVS
jgi:hypothetical protein